MTITREQRLALKRVWLRMLSTQASNLAFALKEAVSQLEADPIRDLSPIKNEVWSALTRAQNAPSYRKFRRTVVHGYDCIMVPYYGMWLGIEKDGYTHS